MTTVFDPWNPMLNSSANPEQVTLAVCEALGLEVE